MSNLPENPEVIPNKVIDLLVSHAFQKNGVDIENVKVKILDEQKQEIKDLIEELSKQVDAFIKQKPSE